jgi:holo-[acyl-carrier protein] synthase|tara:strand:- start:4461 stop:4841 length:381 start_codon:yes stop_codon:yes gene_type:complete
MVVNIGTDIVEIARMTDILERQSDSFAKRVLTSVELQRYQASQNKAAHLAKRFAAKEAIAKALGTGIGHGVSFQDMIITNNTKGAPEVVLSGGAARIMAEQGAHKVLLSLADERHYAIAYAILLGS